jgi:hypothetical protein
MLLLNDQWSRSPPDQWSWFFWRYPFGNFRGVFTPNFLVTKALKDLDPTGSMIHTRPDRWSGSDHDFPFRDF